MRSSQFSIAASAGGAPDSGSQAVERGYLESVAATLEDFVADDMATFVTIYLTQGGDTSMQTVAVLASGYCNAYNPVGWTGRISLGPGMYLRATVGSTVARSVRIGFSTGD